MAQQDSMEVFQDLRLRGPERQRSALREVLLERTAAPWRHAAEKEKEMSDHARGEDVMVFERVEGDGIAAAGLFLWQRPDGYEVTNIVPLQVGELGYRRYNAVLQDFVRRLAEPASQEAGFTVETTPSRQSIDDWLSPKTVDALRRFSSLANKSTGSSHPSDRRRWFQFLINTHEDRPDFNAERLVRWLVEVEGWADEKAHYLAVEYEFGLALLADYDQHLP